MTTTTTTTTVSEVNDDNTVHQNTLYQTYAK